jgi:hypothetical protein
MRAVPQRRLVASSSINAFGNPAVAVYDAATLYADELEPSIATSARAAAPR